MSLQCRKPLQCYLDLSYMHTMQWSPWDLYDLVHISALIAFVVLLRVRSKHAQLRSESRSTHNVLCNSSLDPLCDLPSTFQYPRAPFHGPSARTLGFSCLAQPHTSSTTAFQCGVKWQKDREGRKAMGIRPMLLGLRFPSSERRISSSPSMHSFGYLPSPTLLCRTGYGLGRERMKTVASSTHSEVSTPLSCFSGQEARASLEDLSVHTSMTYWILGYLGVYVRWYSLVELQILISSPPCLLCHAFCPRSQLHAVSCSEAESITTFYSLK